MSLSISRRQVTKAGIMGSALSLIPGKVLGANGKINLAFVGVGGRGDSLIQSFNQPDLVNMVAICDVDLGSKWTAKSEALFPNARRFKDFRVMFDQMANEIDAVEVCVPDPHRSLRPDPLQRLVRNLTTGKALRIF
jgi:hypothetical protein